MLRHVVARNSLQSRACGVPCLLRGCVLGHGELRFRTYQGSQRKIRMLRHKYSPQRLLSGHDGMLSTGAGGL